MRELIGSFQCARKIFVSEIFVSKPDKWFKIWIYIIGICNYREQGVFKKGECLTTYNELQKATKATRSELDHCIRYLKKATQIATRKTTKGFYIKVLKYDYYQDYETYKEEAKSAQKATRKAIQRRQRGDTIKKNDNNDNNDKKEKNFIFNKFQPQPKGTNLQYLGNDMRFVAAKKKWFVIENGEWRDWAGTKDDEKKIVLI